MRPISKTPKNVLRERIANDPDAREIEEAVAHMRPEDFKIMHFEIDPLLAEQIGSGKMRQTTIRLGEETMKEARIAADEEGVKYQQIIRRWLAGCARQSRSLREQIPEASRRKRPITSPHPTEDPRGHGR